MARMPQPSRVHDQKLIQNVLIDPKGGTTRYIFLEQNKPLLFCEAIWHLLVFLHLPKQDLRYPVEPIRFR